MGSRILDLTSIRDEISSKYGNVDFTSIIDEFGIDPVTRQTLYALFSLPEYRSSKGFNKQLLAIGIPSGFTRKLQGSTSVSQYRVLDNSRARSAFQRDVIKIKVYKQDVCNSEIIYEPKSFLFEMSRFPVKNTALYASVPETVSAALDVAKLIPMRDFSFSSGIESQTLQTYANFENDAYNPGVYSFLTKDQRSEIWTNHALSHLFEVYVKSLTNLSLFEHVFDKTQQTSHQFIDESLAQTVIDGYTALFLNSEKKLKAGSNTNAVFASDESPITSVPASTIAAHAAARAAAVAKIGDMSANNVPLYLFGLKQLMSVFKSFSTLTPRQVLLEKLFLEKMFERVFIVSIDPDEFYIDIKQTKSSDAGHALYTSWLAQGRIDNLPGYLRSTDRQRTASDSLLVKYYVTVESFGAAAETT
jgi:hypothetical protein